MLVVFFIFKDFLDNWAKYRVGASPTPTRNPDLLLLTIIFKEDIIVLTSTATEQNHHTIQGPILVNFLAKPFAQLAQKIPGIVLFF